MLIRIETLGNDRYAPRPVGRIQVSDDKVTSHDDARILVLNWLMEHPQKYPDRDIFYYGDSPIGRRSVDGVINGNY